MVTRNILINGNPRLRKLSKPIKSITQEIRNLVNDMVDTMYANRGVGLAAIQVGEARRIIVIDVSKEKDQLTILINPKIIQKSNEKVGTEACLSVPGLDGQVCRAHNVTVKAKNLHLQDVKIEAEGYFAVAMQHEIDHLDGILYIDRIEKGTLKPSNDDDDDDDADE